MAFGVESISVGGQKVAMTALAKYIRYTPYSRSIIMRIIKEMAKRFGIQITKQGFGKIVPVVGALIGGGFNWFFMISVGKRAKSYYRNRLLEWRQNRDPDADLKPIQEPQQFLIDV
ncbi:MAG: EcsC family protein, partial [Chloroflexi bacterium]|nr:EcsC family protein [Chloroflexota bacterium]